MRVAVYGLGRSGLAAARALKRGGAIPTVYDDKPAEAFADSPLREALSSEGIAFEAAWSGEWGANKADLVVTSPGVPKTNSKLHGARANGIDVIGEVELAYRISKAPIVAITGTNGKSTTTLMTFMCLNQPASPFHPVLCGNIYGSGYPEMPLTEAALDSNPSQILVAEISSFQLEWVESFQPRAAIVTNITQDHLNRYESFEEYAATKHRVFRQMSTGDTAVWHATDPIAEPYGQMDTLPSPRREAGLAKPAIRRFGVKGDDAWVDTDSMHVLGSSISLGALPFEESHNRLNAMAAVLLAHGATGGVVPLASQLEGLKLFKGLRHRMERVGEREGILLINNSMCTNPGAVVASSDGLRRIQRLLVGGVDKAMDFAPLKTYLDGSPHSVYLYGTDADLINRQLGGRWPVFKSMREAFDAAARDAVSGEAIMLAPGAASTDQFKDFRDRGDAFCQMAKEWLER